MKKMITAVILLMLLLGTPTGASYYKMKKEIKTYQPPSFYQEELVSNVEIKAFGTENDETKKIEALKSHWAKRIKGESVEEIFFKLKPKISASYHAFSKDQAQVAVLFKKSVSLKDLLILTYLRNPGIKAAENRYLSSIEQFDQAQALDLTLKQYTAFTSGVMTGVGPMKGKDPVQMKYPYPSMFSLKSAIVQNDVTARFEALEAYRRDTLASAKETFWELFYVHKAQSITRKTIGLLNQMENVAKARYEAGRTSFQDVVNIQIKVLKLKEKLKTLQLRTGVLETRTRVLLDLDSPYPIGKPIHKKLSPPVLSLTALKKWGVIERQEIRKMTAMIDKMKLMVEMTETKILPDLSQGYTYLNNQMMPTVGSGMKKNAFSSSVSPTMGKGVPKGAWYGINDAYLNETRLKLRAAMEDKKNMEQKTRVGIEKRYLQFDQWRRDVLLYKNRVIDLSKSAMDVAMAGYESGKVSFAAMIVSYGEWLNANLTLHRSTADQWIAIANLEKVTGVLLDVPGGIIQESSQRQKTQTDSKN